MQQDKISTVKNYAELFQRALQDSDINLLKSIPKSDLHNHAPLGSRLSDLENEVGQKISPPPSTLTDINEMDAYIMANLREHIFSSKGLETSVRLAFRQAKTDGVHKLEMSVDCMFLNFFEDSEVGFIKLLQQIHQEEAAEIQYNPEIGFSRNIGIDNAERLIYPCIESGFFKSIDLYGDELFRDAKHYVPFYKAAKNYGLKLKSHAGEFGTADSVRYTVETLELDEVQHGIAASSSHEVMKWLRNNNIRLNVCPSSNVVLGRVANLRTHPARILADQGIMITINSDDIMIFNQSVSDEYMNLFQSKLFSANELNIIRENGLK
jgi:adenosine deaminase